MIETLLDADIQVREGVPPAGVSGKANLVTPVETPLGPQRVGRFGWKAQAATLLTFSGDAMVNELGITNRLVPAREHAERSAVRERAVRQRPGYEDGPDAQGFHQDRPHERFHALPRSSAPDAEVGHVG
jgi:CxxC motif-containing protein (DUF1111 family)